MYLSISIAEGDNVCGNVLAGNYGFK